MLNLSNAQLLNQIIDLQKQIYTNEVGKQAVFKDNWIEGFSKSDNSIKVVFDNVHFKILYITQNVDTFLGYLAKDFLDSTVLFPKQLVTAEHRNFLLIGLNWALDYHSKCGDTKSTKKIVCGVPAQHKNGKTLRLLFRHSFVQEPNGARPRFSIVTIDDITHLMRADFYWGRMACGGEKSIIHHAFSTDKKTVTHDILSNRDKKLLQLFAGGKEAKEISEILSISPQTVDKRRRYMLAKMGVKTRTGLIHICKMGSII
jgi:DNA-binding CsgD family transcriptional regulator